MTDPHLILALAWSAAFVGGVIAQRLRQPPILGYLLAGVGCTTGKDGPEHDLGWWHRTSPTRKRLMGWLAAIVLLILVLLVLAIVIAALREARRPGS